MRGQLTNSEMLDFLSWGKTFLTANSQRVKQFGRRRARALIDRLQKNPKLLDPPIPPNLPELPEGIDKERIEGFLNEESLNYVFENVIKKLEEIERTSDAADEDFTEYLSDMHAEGDLMVILTATSADLIDAARNSITERSSAAKATEAD